MKVICECRYNCVPRHHSALMSGKRREEWVEKCREPMSDGFLRFFCPFCETLMIMQLCDACYVRCEKWVKADARVTCEGCLRKTTTKKCWSLYKDRK